MNELIVARFWSRVDKNGPIVRVELGPCHLWLGKLNQKGYGLFWNGEATKPATHFVLNLAGIVIPDGMQACHRCDNPPCVNLLHLFVGTGSLNIQDSVNKGRRKHLIGETHNRAVLNEAQALEILNSNESNKALAARFGVCEATVSHVRTGRNWRHLSR